MTQHPLWTGAFSTCRNCLRVCSVYSDTGGNYIYCNHCCLRTQVSDAATPQPDPKPGQDVVLFHVIDDLKRRAKKGKETYGTYLQTHNGRDSLMDAYQEALDLCMYLKQAIMERGR